MSLPGGWMQANRWQSTRRVVVVQRCDEVGSAVAHALHTAGYAVVLTDAADPPWPRRGMSYVDAWYVGGSTLASVDACFCRSVRSIPPVLARGDMVAATTLPWQALVATLPAAALVVPASAANAPLHGFDGIVALFDSVDETTQPAAVAPRAGRFSTRFEIGERVAAGDLLGEVGDDGIIAPASGVLRGLSARGARIAAGQRVAEIDTGGDVQRCYGIEPRARSIAERTVATMRRALWTPRGGGATFARQPSVA